MILPILKGVNFQNNVEYRDIFKFILNVVFIFFISKSLAKGYDSQRKKKNILIAHITSDYDSANEKMQ